MDEAHVAGAEEEGADEETASVETSATETDVDSTSEVEEDDSTIDAVETAGEVGNSELAGAVVDTMMTFVDNEDFTDVEDAFTVVGFDDLQSPNPA